MDRIEKLFRRLDAKNQVRLAHVINLILADEMRDLDLKKIAGTDSFRVRSGRFRIIFHREGKATVVIDTVTLRNERTYKGL